MYYDTNGEAVAVYDVTGFPSAVVIDSNGELAGYYVGRLDIANFEEFLNAII